MQGYIHNIEKETIENEYFRKVLYTAQNLQLVVMSLPAHTDIGEEIHDVDQFFRFEKGQGLAIVDGIEHSVSDGTAVIVPAGVKHNIINISSTESLKLYTLYCPPHHRDGVVHMTKEEAEADSEHFDGTTSKSKYSD